MQGQPVLITSYDSKRLRALATRRLQDGRELPSLHRLLRKLEGAAITPPEVIPPGVITMHSRFIVEDLTSGEHTICTLVFPGEAGIGENRISVFAPSGTALLGRSEGDVVAWDAPGGTSRMRVVRIVYQPELVGDYQQ